MLDVVELELFFDADTTAGIGFNRIDHASFFDEVCCEQCVMARACTDIKHAVAGQNEVLQGKLDVCVGVLAEEVGVLVGG